MEKNTEKESLDKTRCYGSGGLQCSEDCNLKEACLNVIAEKREVLSIHNGTNHRVYIDAVAHWDDLSEMESRPYSGASDSDSGMDEETFADWVKAVTTATDNDADDETILTGSAPSPDAVRFAAEAIRRLFWMLEEKPETTMVLLRRVFLRQNQADHARSRNISRQAVNKKTRGDISGIASLLGLRVPVAVKEAKLLELTPMEFGIYKVCFQDGCTIRSAARQLKISPSKAWRLKCKVSIKLNKKESKRKRSKK